jgi:hypothetical protein
VVQVRLSHLTTFGPARNVRHAAGEKDTHCNRRRSPVGGSETHS